MKTRGKKDTRIRYEGKMPSPLAGGMPATHSRSPRAGRGTVLVAIIIIMAMTAMVASSLMFRMYAEVKAAAAGSRGQQAYDAAMSGLNRVIAIMKVSGGNPEVWQDNPQLFLNQLVATDGAESWYFTVYSPNPGDSRTPCFGLADESGKININVADAQTLLRLPDMTTELVDCLMDYIDADDVARAEGAEQAYYDQLPVPYLIKNGPLMTIEEAILIKGFNAQIVYGEDANLNGILDPNEDDGDDGFPPDNRDGKLNLGLKGCATTISYDYNTDGEGKARVNINGNQSDLGKLSETGLPEQTVTFIKAYRTSGKMFKHPSELLEMTMQLPAPPGGPGPGQPTSLSSGVGAEELPAVLDKLTVLPSDGATPQVGLVNVNSASADVLMAAGLDGDVAQRIVDARTGVPAELKTTAAWLYTEGLMDADAFKAIAPKLTGLGYQFSLRCVGFSSPSGQFRIIDAVIDMAGQTPKILYLRDITRMGLPFSLDVSATKAGG
ncbi:MAG: general secretion pathway protein GspK [Planctomycetes bacterium]|nr:general secretion pathway protein GspK [Planctomycetota bacterium]